ncbi:endonuclease domain-containing protein [Pirellulimonas nuda]|uniref:endonuclease domain-containing protein n=1 Tax=Pirellulimonas nuda TaxID=2528009 RepID=UPI00119F3064|nr:DUF559 domain-containing protein [Pirellulimonas nuda]
MPQPPRKRITKQTRTRAVSLRVNATGPEQKLWNALRARQLSGLKFRRQHPIEPYIVDFFCAEHRLVLELDGDSHEGRQEYDCQREQFLAFHHFRVLRFTNDEVLTNLDGVLEVILKACSVPATDPSPSPSPKKGRGIKKPR